MSTPDQTPRPLPPPLEHPLPPCSLCGQTVEYDESFYCLTCGCSWDSNLSHLDGYSSWDDPQLPQCPAKVMPWKGSTRYPSLAKIVERCLLTEGHDAGRHRSQDDDWTDADTDGYEDRAAEKFATVRLSPAGQAALAAETPGIPAT